MLLALAWLLASAGSSTAQEPKGKPPKVEPPKLEADRVVRRLPEPFSESSSAAAGDTCACT
jgi:hypothetical protein